MEQIYVARIDPESGTLTYKNPLIPTTFRCSTDSTDPSKGWVKVSGEHAAILRKKRVGGVSDPRARPLFQVMTQDDAIHFQNIEMERRGLGSPENPVGGSPIAAARVQKLEAELSAMRDQNAKILLMLTAMAEQKNPSLAAVLKDSTPETLALDLAPATTIPLSVAEKREADAVVAKEAEAKAKASQPAPPKQRPGAAPAGGKKGAGADPVSLTAQMREAGKLGDIPTDIAPDAGTSADVA